MEVVAWQLQPSGGAKRSQQPPLAPGLSPFLTAFWELSSERQYGNVPGPIPSSKIDEWAIRIGASGERLMFRRLMRSLDEVYLSHLSGRQTGNGHGRPQVAKRELTPALFKAVFG